MPNCFDASYWKGRNWFGFLCVELLLLAIIYVFAHSCSCGNEYIQLDKKQTQVVSNLLLMYNDNGEPTSLLAGNSTTDSAIAVYKKYAYIREARTNAIMNYLLTEYDGHMDAETHNSMIRNLKEYNSTQAGVYISNLKIKVRSFFWLTGGKAYLEALFWCLAGVLASLIFYVGLKITPCAEEEKFDINEISNQVAKMFYAPVVTLVLIIGYHFTGGNDTNMIDITVNKGVIIFSFMAGFFSGRLMKFLDRIKELILPISSNDPGPNTKDPLLNNNDTTATGPGADNGDPAKFTSEQIAKAAVEKYTYELKEKFKNIVSVSDSVDDLNKPDSHIVAIYLSDHTKEGIPNELEVSIDGFPQKIATKIIEGMGDAKIHYSQLNTCISNTDNVDYAGTICCGVKSKTDPGFRAVITSAHIYTDGAFKEFNGILNDEDCKKVSLNKVDAGVWKYAFMTESQDMAIAEIPDTEKPESNYMFFRNQYHIVDKTDVMTPEPNVTIRSYNGSTRDAFLLDYNIGMDINYDRPSYKRNIILIGTTNNRDTSKPVSKQGDSGSCVYHKDSKKLIGILLGGNDKFSFVLPIHKTLAAFNLETI